MANDTSEFSYSLIIMNLDIYRQRLVEAVSKENKSQIEKVFFDLEYAFLQYSFWPQELFKFFTDILQHSPTCSVKGSNALVSMLYNEFESMSDAQKRELLDTFEKNVETVGDEMLRHAVADLIARKYAPDETVKLFTQWMNDNTLRSRHMARVGFDVLIMAGKVSGSLEQVARKNSEHLAQREF